MSEQTVAQEQYLTVDEVAEILRYNPQTVRALAREGELQGIKVRSKWLFAKEAIDNFTRQFKNTEATPDEFSADTPA